MLREPAKAQQALKILEAALEAAPDARPALVLSACGGDASLEHEVLSLLAADANAPEGFCRPGALLAVEEPASADVPDPYLGRTIDGFEVERLINEGGMGRVYQATEVAHGRTVALKIMRVGLVSREALRRFQFEVHALARLSHPGIASMYRAGTTDDGTGGVPYFAMEYVPNARGLLEHARETSLSLRGRIELFAAICDAVHHGHQNFVIHRDLKPGNILVDRMGAPRIINFGIARSTDSDLATVTGLGASPGTPQYMSPEQFTGHAAAIDGRSDVYSLGLVLYELVSDSRPYDVPSRDPLGAARVVQETRPQPLGVLDRRLRGDLATIVHKAIEKEPERRYGSAAELAADIRRYLHREPIAARRPTLIYQVRMLAKRHRAAVAGAVAVFGVLVLGIVATSIAASAAWRAEAIAKSRERSLLLSQAEAAIATGDIGLAEGYLKGISEEYRGWEWAHLKNVRLSEHVRVVFPGQVNVGGAIMGASRDGALIATADGSGERIYLFNGKEPLGEVRCPSRARIHSMAVWRNPSGPHALIAAVGERLRIIDATNPLNPTFLADLDGGGGDVALSPDGTLMATAASGVVQLWDIARPDEPFLRRTLIASESGDVLAVSFDHSGRYLASCGDDRAARVWDISDSGSPTPELVLRGHRYHVQDVAFRPRGPEAGPDEVLATASTDGTICLWDLEASRQERESKGPEAARGVVLDTLRGHEEGLRAVAFSSDGLLLASAGADRVIRIWKIEDSATDQPRWEFTRLHGHEDVVNALAFGTGPTLYSASVDGTVREWIASTADVVPTLLGHTSSVNSVVVAKLPWKEELPWGVGVISAGGNGAVRVWDPKLCEQVLTLYGHRGDCRALALDTRNGTQRLASGGGDRYVVLWDLLDLEALRAQLPLRRIPIGSGVRSVAFHPEKEWLAVGRDDGGITVCDLASAAEPSWELAPPQGGAPVTVLRFSPVGRLIAGHGTIVTGGEWRRPLIRVFDILRGEGSSIEEIDQESPVLALAVSPDGDYLVTGTKDGRVRLWNARSLRGSLADLLGHDGGINAITFAPDDHRRFATASEDRTIKMWQIVGRELHEVARLHNYMGDVMDVAWDSDGNFLASVSAGERGSDNVVRLWEKEQYPETRRARTLAAIARGPAMDYISERRAELRTDEEILRDLELRPPADLPAEVLRVARRVLQCDGDHSWNTVERAREVVRQPGRAHDDYERALQLATFANDAPGIRMSDDVCLLILGLARYRVPGTRAKSIQTLGPAIEALSSRTGRPRKLVPAAYAIRAMAFLQVGHGTSEDRQAAARAELDLAMQWMKESVPAGTDEPLAHFDEPLSVELYKEATALLDAGAKASPTTGNAR